MPKLKCGQSVKMEKNQTELILQQNKYLKKKENYDNHKSFFQNKLNPNICM